MIQTNLNHVGISEQVDECKLGVDYHSSFYYNLLFILLNLIFDKLFELIFEECVYYLVETTNNIPTFHKYVLSGFFPFLLSANNQIYWAYHLQTSECLSLEVRLCAGLVQPLLLRLECIKRLNMLRSYLLISGENLWHKLMVCLLNWMQVYSSLNLQHSKHVLLWLSDLSQFLCCLPLWTHSPSLSSTNKIILLSTLLYSFAVDFSVELFVILSESR